MKTMYESNEVAKKHSIEHKKLMRKIRALISKDGSNGNMSSDFCESTYIARNGQKYPSYSISHHGLSLLMLDIDDEVDTLNKNADKKENNFLSFLPDFIQDAVREEEQRRVIVDECVLLLIKNIQMLEIEKGRKQLYKDVWAKGMRGMIKYVAQRAMECSGGEADFYLDLEEEILEKTGRFISFDSLEDFAEYENVVHIIETSVSNELDAIKSSAVLESCNLFEKLL